MRPGITHSTKKAWPQTGAMFLAGLAVLGLVVITGAPAVQAAGKITSILLSDKADDQGVVAKHVDRFAPDTENIYGAATITGAQKGQKVTANLLYGPENHKALTVTKDIPGKGDITLTFAFSKPAKGWPPGDYRVVISTTGGATKEAAFQVK